MGGVRARVSPATMTSARVSVPALLVAVIIAVVRPAALTEPERRPVVAFSITPAGNPVAVNVGRGVPVAATLYCKGAPGSVPTIRAPLMRGAAGAAAIEMVTVVCAAAVDASPTAAVATRRA